MNEDTCNGGDAESQNKSFSGVFSAPLRLGGEIFAYTNLYTPGTGSGGTSIAKS
jgi:hypothetical protein